VHRPLLVSHTGLPGGSNSVLLDLLRDRPPGLEPACVLLGPGPVVDQVRALGVPVEVIRSGRARDARRWHAVIRALRRVIRDHRCDMVFCHGAKGQLYAGTAAALEGTPNVWWQHAMPGQERMVAIAERLPARAIICSSRWTAALQRTRTPEIPIHTVHPGVVVPPATPGAAPAERPVVGVVGRLQRWKRVELVLDTIPRVLEAVPGARFEVIGGSDPAIDPDYPGELLRRVQLAGTQDAVRFTGHLPDAADRIGRFAVLAHAALREPFGLVYLEALARGVPVVASTEGGSTEIVRHGIDGLLVDVCDREAFAAAIVDLLRDPERRAAMGAAGRERVAGSFTVERMVAETWRLVAHAPPRRI
jgi:glycosyltransferase involved in cell wall biosynthesis